MIVPGANSNMQRFLLGGGGGLSGWLRTRVVTLEQGEVEARMGVGVSSQDFLQPQVAAGRSNQLDIDFDTRVVSLLCLLGESVDDKVWSS